ncbi:hypothetical protein EJ110_NYTH32212 [Nymphaea thermarum]|nr:hypothetical protein EJ110_NYTH32212 [Nymphaea thermarum]
MDVFDIGSFSISLRAQLTSIDSWVVFSFIYGPSTSVNRHLLWVDLSRILASSELPHILAGDFNCLLHTSESSQPVNMNPSIRSFQQFVQRHGLCALTHSGEAFTWSNNRMPPCMRILDRVLVSPDVLQLLPNIAVSSQVRSISDHGAIVFSWGSGFLRARPFTYECWWNTMPQFKDVVKDSWQKALPSTPFLHGRSAINVCRKLKRLAFDIRLWLVESMVAKFSNLKSWECELSLLSNATSPASSSELSDTRSRIHELSSLIADWRSRDEIRWKQRSRVSWLALGDGNNSFFHQSASERYRASRISSLCIAGISYQQQELVEAATSFFTQLYARQDSEMCILVLSIPVKVEREINRILKRFLWCGTNLERKKHLVAWEDVTQPSACGGLEMVMGVSLYIMHMACFNLPGSTGFLIIFFGLEEFKVPQSFRDYESFKQLMEEARRDQNCEIVEDVGGGILLDSLNASFGERDLLLQRKQPLMVER